MARMTRIPVPDRGMNPGGSVLATTNNRQATRLVNFLPGYDRKAPVRGPIWDKYPDTVDNGADYPPMAYNQGRRRTMIITDGAPTAAVWEQDGTSVGALAGATVDTVPQQFNNKTANVRGYSYYPCQANASLPAAWATRGYSPNLPEHITRWDGTTTAPVSLFTTGPIGIVDCAEHLDRLFVLGGAPPGTTTASWDEVLYWTDVGGAPTGVIGEWQDDASGLTNQIQLGTEGGNLIGLGHISRALVIFRWDTVQVLYGDTPSTFNLRTVLRNTGAYSKQSICDFDSSVIFLNRQGAVTMFDGSSVANIGEPIQPIVERLLSREASIAIQSNPPFACLSRIAPEWIALNVSYGPDWVTTGDPEAVCFVCHVPSRSWMQLSTNSSLFGSLGAPAWIHQLGERALAWSANGGWWLDDVVIPYKHTVIGDADTPTWRTGRDFDGTNYYYIPGVVETNVQRLGQPSVRCHIDRFGMDYVNQCLTDESPSTGGLEVVLGERLIGDSLTNLTPFDTGYEAAPASDNYNTPFVDAPLRFAMWDVNLDARDLRVTVATPTGAASSDNEVKYMELGDMYVEWQETSRR